MRLILIFVALGSAVAQVTSGVITGLVLDPSDRPVVNAQVTVTNRQQSFTRVVTADSSGKYWIPDLAPAAYVVTCKADRFAPVTANAEVPVDTDIRIDFKLPLAGLEQSITVKAAISPLQTESAELGTVLDRGKVENLPLNRRDFLQLALLTAGVSPPVEGSELATRGNFAMHANGGREEFNNFLLDGVDNNDQDTNRYVLQPSVDSIQEFKIVTNAYGAEYGRSAGGQVNVVTRGGSNEWRGFAYEYLRNRSLDARNFFDASEKPKYIRNQFGAGVGGPVVRNRAFFFGSFDGLRERQSSTRIASVPTAGQRSGDLSELGQSIMDPFAQAPFPGNRIPAARTARVARNILDPYPSANLPGIAANLLAQPVGTESLSQINARLDQRLSSIDQLSLRYSFGDKDLLEPYAEDPSGIPGYGDFLKDRGHNAMANWTRTLGARAINSVLAGFNRGVRRLLPQNYATDVNKLWNVSYLPTRPLDFGYPSVTVAGLSRTGDLTQLPINRSANTYQVSDGLVLVRGSHDVKLGGEIRKVQHNGVLEVFSRGSMSFFGAFTGTGIGDLLLGFPSLAIQSRSDNPQTMRTTAVDGYIQDDWKASPRLTLNLGLRYEYNTPPTDPGNRMSTFNAVTGVLAQVGTKGFSRSGLSPDRTNLGPRIGFAWTPGPDWVVRGGYGIFYDSGMFVVNSSLYFNPPYFNMNIFVPSMTKLLTLDNPFPMGGGFSPAASLSTLDPAIRTSYLQSWNLAIQRALGTAGTITAAYGGSKGTHLIRSRDINQPAPGPGPLEDRLRYPQYANIMSIESGAASSYHSLQLTYNRPMARDLAVWTTYTFSKSIDDTSAFLATKADPNFPQNSRNYHAERALSSFDLAHRVALALVYRVPQTGRILRGLESSAIFGAQTGQPFTPILQQDNSNTGNTGAPSAGSDRPNLLRNPSLAQRSPAKWFDTSAFSIPAPYNFGSSGRNILRGPAMCTIDASLSRRFHVGERASLLVQAQAFNLLNRANFNLPERYADDPLSFGRVFSAKTPRQVQVAVRLGF